MSRIVAFRLRENRKLTLEHLHRENIKDWLLKVADGDEAAFRHIFNIYKRKVYTYILRITGSTDIAEDTLQEIFFKIWRDRARLPGIENFNAYLHRMAQNHAYSGFRTMIKEELALSALKNSDLPAPVHPEQLLLSKETRCRIQDAVNRLPPQQKAVFILSKEMGLKQEAIAQQLGISVLTVKKHLTIVLKVLREEISGHCGFLLIYMANFLEI